MLTLLCDRNLWVASALLLRLGKYHRNLGGQWNLSQWEICPANIASTLAAVPKSRSLSSPGKTGPNPLYP